MKCFLASKSGAFASSEGGYQKEAIPSFLVGMPYAVERRDNSAGEQRRERSDLPIRVRVRVASTVEQRRERSDLKMDAISRRR